MNKKKVLISCICNLAIVVMEMIGLIISFGNHSLGSLVFYTEDSNLLALIACGIYCVYAIRYLREEKALIPRWVHTFKYMTTGCLAVTFLVVIFVLAPMSGAGGYYNMLIPGSFLFHHFLCPVVAMISFVFLEGNQPLTIRQNLYAVVPTLIYAVISVVLNIARVMEGPYPFLWVYKQPVYMSVLWFVLIVGGDYVFAWILRRLNQVHLKGDNHELS